MGYLSGHRPGEVEQSVGEGECRGDNLTASRETARGARAVASYTFVGTNRCDECLCSKCVIPPSNKAACLGEGIDVRE